MARTQNIGRIASGLAVLLGLGVAVAAWLWPRPTEPASAVTRVSVFAGTAASLEVDDFSRAICADRSAVSARNDAQACIWVNTLRDPCFDAGRKVVFCPEPGGTDGLALRVVARISMEGPLSGLQRVSTDQAVADSYPWAIRLEGHKDWCVLRGFDSAADRLGGAGSHNYYCSDPHFDLITDPQTFFRDPQVLSVRTPETPGDLVVVRALTRNEGATWTAQLVSNDGNLGRQVAVEEVEY